MLSGLPSAICTHPLGSWTATSESGCSGGDSATEALLLCILLGSSFLFLTLHLLLFCVFFLLPPASLLLFSVTSHSASCFLCTQPVLPCVLFRSLGESIFSNTCCPNKIVTGLSVGDVWHFTNFNMAGNACFVMLWNTVFCAWFYFYLSMF